MSTFKIAFLGCLYRWWAPKCPIWIFHLWHFPTIFVLSKVTCLATLTLFLRLSNTVNSFKIIKKVSILGSHCLKITQYVAFEFLNFSISHQFPSGNTVWPQLQVIKNSPNWTIYWHFYWTFVYQKCNSSSLHSQY